MAVTTESRNRTAPEPVTEKGMSLARGPALILGTILLAVGLYFIYKQHTFPKFSNFPNGHAHVDGKVLFSIFGGNGWTGMLTAICGGLLLFGAAQHLLAKTMSLIVGVVLAAAAIIGLVNSGNVLGLASANHLTELGWGVAAVILLVNTLVPRRTRTVEPGYGRTVESGRPRGRHRVAEGAAAGAAAGAVAEHEHDRHRERREERREERRDAEGETTTGRGRDDRAAVDEDRRGDRTANDPDGRGARTSEDETAVHGQDRGLDDSGAEDETAVRDPEGERR